MKVYGKYFTSSVSWMIADAIEAGAKEIAIYGVTMSSNEEYGHQKPACSYLLGWARGKGIKVTIQKDSELMSTLFVYGYEEVPSIIASLKDKKGLAEQDISQAESDVF